MQHKYQKRRLSYGIDILGNIVHIDEVKNGKECGCFYPACKEPLIAKNSSNIKVHHFAHVSGVECETAYETILHLLAKERIRKAFLTNSKFIMDFEYESHCSKERNCDYFDNGRKCYIQTRHEFNLKDFYDSCEQELSYDNIKRRSDLKLFSSTNHIRLPIYVEFCVTHASTIEKLHSGNKIIEVTIESEKDIDNIVKNGFIEDKGQSDKLLKSKVQFFGFKKSDYNNHTIIQDIEFVRYVLYKSGKQRCFTDYSKCNKPITKSDINSLCEICFYTCVNYGISEYAKYRAFSRYKILNCVLCKNYVQSYYGIDYICRYYKYLHIPLNEKLDTARAKTCPRFEFNYEEQKTIKGPLASFKIFE